MDSWHACQGVNTVLGADPGMRPGGALRGRVHTVDVRSDMERREQARREKPAGWMTAEQLHRTLAAYNRERLEPGLPSDDLAERLTRESTLHRMELAFLCAERTRVAPLLRDVPDRPGPFVEWFASLGERGPGQSDPLFDYLAERATLAEMRWFLLQEVAGEAGFDDLVALTQVKMPTRPKLEMARNYWDELGRGRPEAMHGPLLEALAKALGLTPTSQNTVWEATALGNLMAGLACNRAYAYHAVGALGAVELTAPSRVAQVDAGLGRLGLPAPVRRYFTLHATLDVRHSETWSREVLAPLVEGRPEVARALAEGALMRLSAGARCFERYRRELGVPAPARVPSTLH